MGDDPESKRPVLPNIRIQRVTISRAGRVVREEGVAYGVRGKTDPIRGLNAKAVRAALGVPVHLGTPSVDALTLHQADRLLHHLKSMATEARELNDALRGDESDERL